MVWLLSMALLAVYSLGLIFTSPVLSLDYQGPVIQITGRTSLDLVYFAVFGLLTFTSTIAGFTSFESGAAGESQPEGAAAACPARLGTLVGGD